jgi:hypothetical protein
MKAAGSTGITDRDSASLAKFPLRKALLLMERGNAASDSLSASATWMQEPVDGVASLGGKGRVFRVEAQEGKSAQSSH